MMKPRLVLCSGATIPPNSPLRQGRRVVELDTIDTESNTHLRLENLTDAFLDHLAPRLIDLLEIAAYVYTADCEASRELAWMDDKSTEPWSRDYRFVVPVRDLEFWMRADVREALTKALNYLSSDSFEFSFERLTRDRRVEEYLQIENVEDQVFYGVDRVIMFSGGLDSLAGATECAKRGENVVLVSHRPAVQINRRQMELVKLLREKFKVPIMHIPVWVNKSGFGRESTQRTRSFLFSSLGAVVADVLKAGGVRFYENGTISLNWPLADEALRSRASRTTHPESMRRLQNFLRLVTGNSDFVVDNPYIFKTKTEVVKILDECGAGDLVKHSCSCAHTMFQPRDQRHCGRCGQCIDRRVALLDAGMEQYDNADDYVIDVFTGPRELNPSRPYDHNIAVNYARFASDINEMTADSVAVSYNKELASAARCFPNAGEAAQKFIDMHKRHADAVTRVLTAQLASHAADFVSGKVSATSMLAMIGRGEHLAALTAAQSAASVDRDGNIFRKAGDFWDICYEERHVRLKHSKGLVYIAFLLQNPDKEFQSLHLVMDGQGTLPEIRGEYSSMTESELEEHGLHISGFTGTGEIMDAKYAAEVKKQLKRLQKRKDMAEARGDMSRVSEIDAEISQYMRALAEGIGLSGRRRNQANPAEKARVSVRQAITRILDKLEGEHPTLYEHLKSSLTTGAKCTYIPSTPIHWNL